MWFGALHLPNVLVNAKSEEDNSKTNAIQMSFPYHLPRHSYRELKYKGNVVKANQKSVIIFSRQWQVMRSKIVLIIVSRINCSLALATEKELNLSALALATSSLWLKPKKASHLKPRAKVSGK